MRIERVENLSQIEVETSPSITETNTYQFLTYLFGIIYLVSWSLSFYPQARENFRRKNVKGISFEFAILHPLAYLFYTIYTYTGRIDHHSGTGVVTISDILFSTHGFALTTVHLTQCLIYSRGGDNRYPQRWCLIFLGVEIGLIGFFFILEVNGSYMPLLMQTQMMCGYGLVLTNVYKYSAQFYYNQRRRSTVGFSIKLVFLDFTGSLFSLLQLIMDSIGRGELVLGKSAFNLVKCLLSCIGIIFDIAFMIQHYWLYKYAVNYDIKKQEYGVKRDKRGELTEMVQAKLQNFEVLENLQSGSDKSRSSQHHREENKQEEFRQSNYDNNRYY
ncbi:UNKNOWN [Stylonychia lemnae]|uniref:Uncharacterized protein n=1 Tax=Stylonychia lemnae TaxID=5949 RepID=A0A078AVC3_STYLE|nr:UNKNOWN [Stylonychia lemnae]|eukprot:CDW86335.1 UNKNOWN [Stylonychia lemnae]